MDRIQLHTSLAPEECCDRVYAAIDSESPFSRSAWTGSKPVVGRASNSVLRLRRRIAYRNSFQTIMTATLRRDAGGTVVTGTFGMHPAVQVLMVVWFGGVILLGGPLLLSSIGVLAGATGNPEPNQWLGVAVPPFMLAFGYGLIRLGRYLARDEARFLTEFLVRTIDADVGALPAASRGGPIGSRSSPGAA